MNLSRLAVLAVTTLVVTACASVSVTNEWRDPGWSGPPASNVLVVGVARGDTTRRIFEDTFVQQLHSAGYQAAASYASIPPGSDGSAKLGELVKHTGAEIILVTRLQRVEQRVNVTPSGPGYGGFYGWYGGAWASTPSVTQYEVVTLETSIWDARSEKLVWTVTTQGLGTNDIPKATQQLAATLIPKLKADGVLR
ncbi:MULTISPECIES: DUF4136 domain-containing protein [Dyella]|uniref:DUF4136 domain-containing protein n=2 Tax=Dyella TaxID=231454 RepID=A0A4R0YU10_9GAMM|nr:MULTISPECIES: DUF4136 domain-containing protein [Dyella]TBR39519.1 hypothetical protein EYV96_04725 [Dyella terrae]TCI12895.1 hypothetical protein EZM97_06145 [Dyella soli]